MGSSGYRFSVLGLKPWGLGFRVWELGFRIRFFWSELFPRADGIPVRQGQHRAALIYTMQRDQTPSILLERQSRFRGL